MLMTPPRCWRRRDDCEPMHSVEALPESEAAIDAMCAGESDPESFVCVGCVVPEARNIPQDAYRLCWKNTLVDEMGDYDEQDLTHTQAVISQALAMIATRRVNGGMIETPTLQSDKSEAA